MTEYANSVISDALSLILVQGDEEPIEATTAQLAIRVLNRMMNRLTIYGINLGFTEVTNLKTQMTVPDASIDSIVKMLAYYLHSFFGTGQPNPLVVAGAKDAIGDLTLGWMEIAPSEYPENLPRGSGLDLPDYARMHFYGDLEDTILAEIAGYISLEDSTNP